MMEGMKPKNLNELKKETMKPMHGMVKMQNQGYNEALEDVNSLIQDKINELKSVQCKCKKGELCEDCYQSNRIQNQINVLKSLLGDKED